MAIIQRTIKVATTGSNASATGSAQESFPVGKLLACHYNFSGSAPGTTDTTLTKVGGDLTAVTILTLTNVNTDAWYFPMEQDDGNTGSAITGSYQPHVIHNGLLVAIAGADALSPCLTLTVFVEV